MHDQQSPHRLHSEHGLSLTYADWLTLKNHEHLLASHHHRQQTLRNTVLTLFRQYQSDTAYLCWHHDKRRQGCWDSRAEEAKDEAVDASTYHFRIGSVPFEQSSSPQFLRWAEDKRRLERDERRQLREQQTEQKRREDEEARQQHERAQAEYSKWHSHKTQQLTHRRTQQHSQQLAQRAATQHSRAEQQHRADTLYEQWKADKHSQQQRHEQRQQRRQQRQEAAKRDKRQQFDVLYPQAIAQYVATVDKWRREERAARQRQVDRERARAGKGVRPAKKETLVVQPNVAAMGPASLLDLQTASSSRLSAGKRVSHIKPSFAASTASTAAMSASAVSASSLFDSFSSSSSSASVSGAFAPSASAPSTARSTASEPIRSKRASSARKRVVPRPPWNNDWNDVVAVEA